MTTDPRIVALRRDIAAAIAGEARAKVRTEHLRDLLADAESRRRPPDVPPISWGDDEDGEPAEMPMGMAVMIVAPIVLMLGLLAWLW